MYQWRNVGIFLRHTPIEITYAIIVFSAAGIACAITYFLNPDFVFPLSSQHLSYLLGGDLFGLPIAILLLYGLLRAPFVFSNNARTHADVMTTVWRYMVNIGSLAAFVLLIDILLLPFFLMTSVIGYWVDGETVRYFTQVVATGERAVFGIAPHWLLQYYVNDTVWLEWLIIQCYAHIALVTGTVITVALFAGRHHLRALLLAFSLAFVLAVPAYLVVPISFPFAAEYRQNIFGFQSYDDRDAALTFMRDNRTPEYFTAIEQYGAIWEPKKGWFAITANPSMHIAWSVILFLAAYRIWWLFGTLLLPWVLFSSIGTVFTLQHYTVDIVGGVIVGVLAFYIAARLIEWQERSYTPRFLYATVDIIRDDMRRLISEGKRDCAQIFSLMRRSKY